MLPAAIRTNGPTSAEGIQHLAAAILQRAVQDLESKRHRQDAARFLYSELAEVCAGCLGIDYIHFRRRLQRAKARRAARNRRTA